MCSIGARAKHTYEETHNGFNGNHLISNRKGYSLER